MEAAPVEAVQKRLHLSDNAIFFFLIIQVVSVMVSVAASSIAFGIAVALWLAKMVLDRRPLVQRTPLDYFFLAYVLAEILSTATAAAPAESFLNMKRLLLIVVVYLTASVAYGEKRIKLLLGLLVGVASVLSILEIAMLFLHHQSRLHLFQHYMTTGGMKMVVLLLLVPFLLHRETPVKLKVGGIIALVPVFVALLLTYTRSAWLGFVAGAVVMGAARYRWVLPSLLVLVLAFFLFAPASLTERATSIVDPNDPTVASRLTMWSTGLKIFADHPLLGIGDVDVHEAYARYKSPGDEEFGGHLHSNYVQLLVTLGSFGFVVVMALFLRILTTEFQKFRQWRSDWLFGSLSLGSLSVFVGFLVAGLFEWNFGDHEIMTLVWATVGLSLVGDRDGT